MLSNTHTHTQHAFVSNIIDTKNMPAWFRGGEGEHRQALKI